MMTWCRLRVVLQSRAALLPRYYATESDEFPRITVPQRMIELLGKHNVRIAKLTGVKNRQRLKTLVISSRNTEHQYYKGQKFNVFDPRQLASHGWKNRKCNYDFFSLVSHKPNPAIISGEEQVPTFSEMDLDARIVQFLHDEGIVKPTNIQTLVIPKMRAGKHLICAAETGSGKTYAYLLPLIHNILQLRKKGLLPEESKNSPCSVVVVPSIELANQIMGVCERLSDKMPFTPFLVNRGRKNQSDLREDGGQLMDILISTPGVLNKLFTKNSISMSKLMSIVLDEADTLLDDSFNAITRNILRKLQIGRASGVSDTCMYKGIQVALVSATFPRGLDETVGDVLPVDSFIQVTTNHLHRLMPHVTQKFIKMKSVDRIASTLSILKKKKKQTYMIFCNKQDACLYVSKSLEEMGLDNVCVTGFLDEQERYRQFRSFLEGEINIIVCTDLASRGIDTYMVDHVINYDFPNYLSDYIHRAGRVGRVGGKSTGQVTSIVINPWEVDLVWKIEIAARRQTELHNVNANIKRKINSIVPTKKGLDLRVKERSEI